MSDASSRGVKVVTAVQMAALEQTSESLGVSTDRLMENAGLAVAQVAREMMGGAAGARVVALIGPGNTAFPLPTSPVRIARPSQSGSSSAASW